MTTREYTIIVREEVEGNGFTRAAHDMDRLADSSDRTGKHLAAATTDLQKLDKEIETSSKRIRALSTEFSRTGNQSLFGDLRKERSFLANLQKIRKDVAAEVEQAARDITPGNGVNDRRFRLSLPKFDASNVFGELRGQLMIALVAGIVLALPAIGAALSGAVVAGGVLAGIAGGIIAAAHDNRVIDAWQNLVGGLTAGAFGAEAFVVPVVDAIHTLQGAFQDLRLDEAFAKAAPAVHAIAEGIADFARNIMPGFNEVLDHSAEIGSVFGAGLADLGDALSDFLHEVITSKGTLEGLHFLFMVLGGAVRNLGGLLHGLGEAFDFFIRLGERTDAVLEGLLRGIALNVAQVRLPFEVTAGFLHGLNDWLHQITGTAAKTGDVAVGLAESFLTISPVVRQVTQTFDELNQQMDDYWNLERQIIGSNLDVESSLMDMADAFAENGDAWGKNTREGIANEEAVLRAVDAAKALRDEMLKNESTMADADAVFQNNIDKINAQAEAGGIAASNVHALTDALRQVPAMTQAQLRLVFETGGTLLGEHAGLRLGELGFRAGGGPVSAGGAYVVGEHGPELLQMGSQSGYVTPGGMGQTPVVISFAATGDPLLDAILQALRKHVRLSGGVQAAFT